MIARDAEERMARSLTMMMEQAALRPENVPVTVVINWLIKPGKEQDFEEWVKGVDEAAMKFPGYLGLSIIPPNSAQPEYVMIFKFDLYSSLKRWAESKERKEWMERAKSLTQRDPNVELLTGLENWFTLPDQGPPPKPPARYKMAIISALAIFPLIILLNALVLPLIKTLPFPLPPLIMVGLISTSMTYLIMPRLTRLFYRWLYPSATR
jgi:hypothetical protein